MNTDNISKGLSASEVSESRRLHGTNVLTPPKKTSLWKLYLDKYRDPIIQILLVAAAISLALAFVEHDFIETIGIFLAIFLATTVGFYFERDAAKKFNVLTAMSDDQMVKVRRDGKVVEIARHDVVVGDVVLIETGDEVPADGQLFEANSLQIDESSLTGEPLSVKRVVSAGDASKAADSEEHSDGAYPADMVLRSSMVMQGRGEFVVTAVGDSTEIGKVARKSSEQTDVKTPLNMQLDRLAKLISKVGSIVAVAAFVIFLVHDIITNTALWHSNDYFGMAQVVLNYFMMAVTLIVMAVPEGLPMAVTLALALNMRRMLKSNNLVRKLHACETMGAVTVICTDKTGTLTQNKMQVAELLTATGTDEPARLLDVAISANSTAELDGDKGIGNPTEVALLLWLKGHDADYRKLRQSVSVISQQPFSTEKKCMETTVSLNGHEYSFLKGAPEIVISRCAIDSGRKAEVEAKLLSWQQKAMRTLAFAIADVTDGKEARYTLQAVCAISDPVRKEVPEAVRQCRSAGIKVKIVTGDTTATALEIGRQIGIIDDSSQSVRGEITGPEWAALSDEEALERCDDIRVMSRARPTDKQRLVEMLQKRGEVVAVTGDGTNDAPALHYAHVGLSLGSGTSVAKQASDMTLLDDSFSSIVNAVMWGRSLYKNIQRFLFFQLVVNLTALLIVLAGSIIGTAMPLTVTQILWVNIIMDTFAALALASLPPSREVMRDKPRKQTDSIITRPMKWGILICGGLFFIVMFAGLIYCERNGNDGISVHELTLFFTTFVMLQWWNLFNAKAMGSHYSAFRRFYADKGLILVLLLILAGQWLVVTFGGRMFRTEPLSLGEWATIIAATSLVLWIGEAYRFIRYHR